MSSFSSKIFLFCSKFFKAYFEGFILSILIKTLIAFSIMFNNESKYSSFKLYSFNKSFTILDISLFSMSIIISFTKFFFFYFIFKFNFLKINSFLLITILLLVLFFSFSFSLLVSFILKILFVFILLLFDI